MIDVIEVGVDGSIASRDKESEDMRWREWKRQGRDDDARFRRRVRTVFIDVVAFMAVGGGLWFALQIWL